MKFAHASAILLLFFCLPVLAQDPVEETRTAVHAVTGVMIARGRVDLPARGWWTAQEPYRERAGMIEIFLEPVDAASLEAGGERQGSLADRRAIRARRDALRQLYWACDQFAHQGDGRAPENLTSLTQRPDGERGRFRPSAASLDGLHLIGGTRLYNDPGNRQSRVQLPELLAFDTRPAIDDGKHWVANTQGQLTRVAVDAERFERDGLELKPVQKPFLERMENASETVAYHIYARLLQGHGTARSALRNPATHAVREVLWDTAAAEPGDPTIIRSWAALRTQHLARSTGPDSPLGSHWVRQWVRQYGLEFSADSLFAPRPPVNRRQRGRAATAMGVLGGRAAIQETLQLRSLAVQAGADLERRIPIADLKGVEVASHPFEAMLADSGGKQESLPLAEWVPHDRFLAYFPDPKGLFSLLEGGSAFIHESGSSFTERKAAYRLKERYLERLGLSEPLLKSFLDTGVLTELAVILPDLFLIDGTDLTIVARTGNAFLTKAALALLGVQVTAGTVVKANAEGQPVVWSLQGDILIVSSSEKELAHAQDAHDKGSSLGTSAELRYMLTQVPISPRTRIYTYFSDPFIRRLVGPAVKIGQVRRLQARVALEEASSAAVLARFDGHADPDIDSLLARKYLDPVEQAGRVRLDANDVSVSDLYGSVAHLTSLEANPVEAVSPAEKEAYDRYREIYNRYWRRFFDPIAVRYEALEDGSKAVTTFILPLVDNSLYTGLKDILIAEDDHQPLIVPVIEPEPVAMLSLNLNEEAWLEMIDDLSEPLEAMAGMGGEILDQLGPDFHLAIHDADPVIALGSGELQGILGQFGGRIDSDMTMIPILVSLLTRPTSFLIGLQDPDGMKAQLNAMTVAGSPNEILGFGEGTFYRVTGEERWIYKFSLEGLMSIRFGFEVKDRYLVVTNLPFRQPFRVTAGQPAPNRAAYLSLSPRASELQLPSLFASAVEKHRRGALSGEACLRPILLAGRSQSVADAQALHFQWFGFEPQHPAGGAWQWEGGELVSALYGGPWNQEQPAYDPDNSQVGILNRAAFVDLSMQFEHDGLRSTARWWLK